ncbi:DoxX family protein [Microlunatus speluncae]|uniref:DoxX family protein n=1 Tax=Microlunatus speluncae TaxID=2594267 RepID=UPI0012665221|nr:DoxX family protein [Microlunatus speluncae]
MGSPLNTRRDLGLLIVRIGLGVVMIAHGWQKYALNTIDGTRQGFAQLGVPFPELAAPGVTALEIFGGAAIILGLLTPLVGIAYTATMIGAAVLVHGPNGFFAGGGGYEFVALLAVLSLGLAVAGAGRFSLDHLLVGRRREQVATARAEATPA